MSRSILGAVSATLLLSSTAFAQSAACTDVATATTPACIGVTQEVVPIDPVTGIQGFGALGATTTLSIIAGVVAVGFIVSQATSATSTD